MLNSAQSNLDCLMSDLSFFLQSSRFFHILQYFLGFFDIPFAPKLLSLGQHLSNLFIQLMDTLGLFCGRAEKNNFKK